jgi:2-phosphoglycerate kinase
MPERGPDWLVLLVGGASGTGKSSLAAPLARRLGVSLVEVDDFQLVLEATLPPEQLPLLHFWRDHREEFDAWGDDQRVQHFVEVCEDVFRPGIEAVIGARLELGVPVVVEGDFLLPQWVTAENFGGQPNEGRVRALFVTEDDEQQLLANFHEREREVQEVRAHASHVLDGWLRRECERWGVPTVAARPWDTVVERALALLSGALDAVVITGVYGAGKSSLAAEVAEALERRGVAYGALDLDWLMWFAVPALAERAADDVYLANVTAVVANYRAAGVRHLVLAGAVRDRAALDALRAAVGGDLRVVRLEVPRDEIVRRLRGDPTSGRADDLQVAEAWLDGDIGVGIEDLAVANTGSIPELAERVIAWLGWTA